MSFESPLNTVYGHEGEHMDALEEFDTNSFVSRLLGKGDMKKLVEKLGDIVPEEKQMEMMEQMQKGSMTMRTFRSLMEQFSSAGPMSSVCFCSCSTVAQVSSCRTHSSFLALTAFLQDVTFRATSAKHHFHRSCPGVVLMNVHDGNGVHEANKAAR